MEETRLARCAHCSATCIGEAGVSLHFLTKHYLRSWFSSPSTCLLNGSEHFLTKHYLFSLFSSHSPCPLCGSEDNSLMHILVRHRSACLLCLKDASAGAYAECHTSFAKATKAYVRFIKSWKIYSS